jgi:plasmid stabilization system protein ParE
VNVVFEDEALSDLHRIFDWISEINRPAAEKLVARIFDRVENLAAPELTYTGRPSLDPGTRELIEYPYIIVYEVSRGPRRDHRAFRGAWGTGSRSGAMTAFRKGR